MSDDFSDFETVPFDPASMPTSSLGIAKAVWYRRPWILTSLAVVLIVAISVVVDLPRPTTKAQDVASQNATIKQINGDLAECAFAVNESFHIYNLEVAAKLSASDKAQVPILLTGDETACSFASQPVYDLTNNIQVQDTKAGKHIDRMLSVVEHWITDNALASIKDIQYLFNHHADASTIRHLGYQERQLAIVRTQALSDEVLANRVFGLQLDRLKIPSLPHLRGT